MLNLQTSIQSRRIYGIELRERNYPEFTGKYNAYVEIYGALENQYIGLIEIPLKMNVSPEDLPELLNMIPDFIMHDYTVSKF